MFVCWLSALVCMEIPFWCVSEKIVLQIKNSLHQHERGSPGVSSWHNNHVLCMIIICESVLICALFLRGSYIVVCSGSWRVYAQHFIEAEGICRNRRARWYFRKIISWSSDVLASTGGNISAVIVTPSRRWQLRIEDLQEWKMHEVKGSGKSIIQREIVHPPCRPNHPPPFGWVRHVCSCQHLLHQHP